MNIRQIQSIYWCERYRQEQRLKNTMALPCVQKMVAMPSVLEVAPSENLFPSMNRKP